MRNILSLRSIFHVLGRFLTQYYKYIFESTPTLIFPNRAVFSDSVQFLGQCKIYGELTTTHAKTSIKSISFEKLLSQKSLIRFFFSFNKFKPIIC